MKKKLKALRDTLKVLGNHWFIILTYVNKGDSGNGEFKSLNKLESGFSTNNLDSRKINQISENLFVVLNNSASSQFFTIK